MKRPPRNPFTDKLVGERFIYIYMYVQLNIHLFRLIGQAIINGFRSDRCHASFRWILCLLRHHGRERFLAYEVVRLAEVLGLACCQRSRRLLRTGMGNEMHRETDVPIPIH